MRTMLVVCLVTFSLALEARAQPGFAPYSQPFVPTQGGGAPYPQAFQPPPPQPTGPNIYFGEQPHANTPGSGQFVAPQPAPMPQQFSPSPGNGSVEYFYPNNPLVTPPFSYNYNPYGQVGRPYPTPDQVPATTGWPTPTPTQIYERTGDVEQTARAELDRLNALPFHRKTNEKLWVSGDFMTSLIRPMRMNGPLLTAGSPFDPSPGALGQPGTSILFPRSNIDFGLFTGARLEAGMFLDSCDRLSLEIGGFYLWNNTNTFNAGGDSTGNSTLSRPVYNVNAGEERAFLNSIPLPVVIVGTFNAEFKSALYGAELNARYHSYWWHRFHSDVLAGLRFMNLSESMRIQERLTPQGNFLTFLGAGNFVTPPNILTNEDSFRTVNYFYGAQIGTRLNWEHEWFSVGGFAKLALGATQQNTTIAGSTSVVSPGGGTVTAPGAVLALPTNIGNYQRTVFSVLPEFGLSLGVELTCFMRLDMGYSFLLWNRVVRPGSQYDRNINTAQAPSNAGFGPLTGTAAPIYRFNEEMFWVNNFTVGVTFRY